MQTIEFKLPDNANIHTFETDDSLWDTWGEVKINGEDWRVNVWYDDTDEGILLSIYPYIMVAGEWVTDYCDFTSCIIVNVDELTVDVNKPEPEEKNLESSNSSLFAKQKQGVPDNLTSSAVKTKEETLEDPEVKIADFEVGNMSEENYEKVDLHKHIVDQITLVSPSGKPMKRESDFSVSTVLSTNCLKTSFNL